MYCSALCIAFPNCFPITRPDWNPGFRHCRVCRSGVKAYSAASSSFRRPFFWVAVCLDGALTLWDAVLLIMLFLAFIAENVYSASKNKEHGERPQVTKKILLMNLLKFVLGAAALAVGSNLLVDNGKYLAKLLGVPERIIAITLISIGTSLPELVTAITALIKKQGSMSVGNIIGANIIDITMILPICAFISGGTLQVPVDSFALDMPVCLAVAAVALIPTLIFKKFHRAQGIIMVGGYAAYLIYSVLM